MSNIYSILSIYTIRCQNDLLKMDAPFWGGVDIFPSTRKRTRMRIRSRSFLWSFFHVRLSQRCSNITLSHIMLCNLLLSILLCTGSRLHPVQTLFTHSYSLEINGRALNYRASLVIS